MKLKSILIGATLAGSITLLTTKYSGKERIKKVKKSYLETKTDFHAVIKSFQQTKENLEYTQYLAKTLLPDFHKDLQQDIDTFCFQLQPRLERLQEQITKLNCDLHQK